MKAKEPVIKARANVTPLSARLRSFPEKAGSQARTGFHPTSHLLSRRPSITIVVPTYKEVESLPHLIDCIAQVRQTNRLPIDVIIVDDDSRDGSVELIRRRPEEWVQILVRTGRRGLSEAVLEGFHRATGDVLVCMDADLSHPPDAIVSMIRK